MARLRVSGNRPPLPEWVLAGDRHEDAKAWAILNGWGHLELMIAVSRHKRREREARWEQGD